VISSKAICIAALLFPLVHIKSQTPYVDLGHDPSMATLLQILSNPNLYDGKEVEFIAYLNLEFESDTLWLHKEDRENAILGNSIWVSATPEMEKNKKQLRNKYVLVRGIFDSNNHGHLGMHSGALKSITKCVIWSDPKHPRGFLPPPPPPPLPPPLKRVVK
jgi:hypothetical protein